MTSKDSKVTSIKQLLTKSTSKGVSGSQCRSPAIMNQANDTAKLDQKYSTAKEPIAVNPAELAKIHDTCATKFDNDDLIQPVEG